jgi:hypothetical protein
MQDHYGNWLIGKIVEKREEEDSENSKNILIDFKIKTSS